MRVSSLRWGIILIGIGLFFLAINLELLDSLVFPRLLSLWPVLLIAIGIELIFRRTRFYFLALLSPLLIALAFIVAATGELKFWNSLDFWKGWKNASANALNEIAEIPLDSLTSEIDLHIKGKESQLVFQAHNNRNISVKASYQRRAPLVEYSLDGSISKLLFEERSINRTTILGFRQFSPRAVFEIYHDIPLSLSLSTKASNSELNLGELKLKKLELDLDCNSLQIELGDFADSALICLNGQVGNLTLILPEFYNYIVSGDDSRSVEMMNAYCHNSDKEDTLLAGQVVLELNSLIDEIEVKFY